PRQNNMETQDKKYWIGGYAVLATVSLAIHYFLQLFTFSYIASYMPVLKKLSMSLFLIFIILLLGKVIEKIIDTKTEIEGDRYNLQRISRLLTYIFILIVAISFLLQNLYTAAVSFGLISLVLGFALQ